MNFLKLNSSQYIELEPRCNCSVHTAIEEAIDFVNEHDLKGADLNYEGFTFGIYPDDYQNNRPKFVRNLELEFKAWLKTKLTTETEKSQSL